MNIHLIQNGQQVGPFSKEQAEGMIKSGMINYETMAWADGHADWKPLREIVGATIPPLMPTQSGSDNRILPAFLLAFFLGVFGAHRFYVGKIGTGILMLLTLGGFGIWATIDWILILCKAFTGEHGKKITAWT